MRKWPSIHLTHFGEKKGRVTHIFICVWYDSSPVHGVLLSSSIHVWTLWHYFWVGFPRSYSSVIISFLVPIHFRTGRLLSYPPYELHGSQAEQAESCSEGGRRESRSWGQGGRIVHIMKVTQGSLGGHGAAEHGSWDMALWVSVCVCGMDALDGKGRGGVLECVRIYDVCTEKQQR